VSSTQPYVYGKVKSDSQLVPLPGPGRTCYQLRMTSPFSPTLLLDTRNMLGECPRWHAGEQALYWVDIAERSLHCWSSTSRTIKSRQFGQPIACFAFRQGGGLLLGMKNGCALLDHWAAQPVAVGPQILADKPQHRMNDGRTDPAGRFWVGSVNSAKDAHDAALYRLDSDGDLTEIEGGMLTCNGAAFSSDGRFAHADTPSHAVRIYDCDPAAGTLSGRRILHQFATGVGPGLGRPDGGSFDAEGCYWTAMFDGWRVVRLSPAGELIREIPMPIQRPTMIAFGGEDGRTAFVTTARTGLSDAELAEQPGAGGVFSFRVDVPGVPEWPAAL
jgi:sugar lactone lactonase YvrE